MTFLSIKPNNSEKMALYKARWWTFFTLSIVFITLFSASFASALDFDNVFTFDKTIGNYGKYFIENLFGFGGKLADLELIENTEICWGECYAIAKVELYKKGVLVQDTRFYRLNKDQKTLQDLNYILYYKIDDGEWTEFTIGQEFSKGEYLVKLIGYKPELWTVDWQMKSNGIWSEEWAIWTISSVTEYQDTSSPGTYTSYDYPTVNKSSGQTFTIGTVGPNVSQYLDKIGLYLETKVGSPVDTVLYIKETDGANTPIGAILAEGVIPASATPGGEYYNVTMNPHILLETGKQYYISFYNNTGDGSNYFPTQYSTGDPYAGGTLFLDDSNASQSDNDLFFIIYSNLTENPNVTLQNPVNNYATNSGDVLFNCSAHLASGVPLTNITLWTNYSGTWQIDNSTTGLTNATENVSFYKSMITGGKYIWSCEACDSDGDCLFASENRTVIIDDIYPTISITSPLALEPFAKVNDTLYLNWTVTDTNLDSLWFNYNGTNQTVYGATNSTTFTIESYSNRNITFYANDTAGNVNSTVRSWDYKVWENSQTYNATTTELKAESFIVNITYYDASYNLLSGNLNYNSTIYSGTSSGSGDTILYSASVETPQVTTQTNIPFYWNFTLNNGTTNEYIQTATVNQTINQISFGVCNATFNVSFINFTTKSATNPYPILNASFQSTWRITSGNSSTYKNVSYEDTSETNSSFAFCFSPEDKTYIVDADIEYDATGYAQNYYYLNDASLTNTTNNISLYLLNDSLATLTVLRVIDEIQNPIEDIVIQIQSYDVGTDTYYTVANAKTSFDGEDIAYLNWYDTFYKFILLQDGSIVKTITPYKIVESPQIFQITTTITYPYDKFDDLQYNLYYSNITGNFILTFTDPTGLVSAACLRVIKREASGDTSICDDCETSSSATISCNILGYGNGTYVATFYATGSLKAIETIYELIGVSGEIYNLIGNIDATFYAILFSGIVLSIFLISPVLAIIGLILGMIGGMALGFQPVNYLETIGIIILGVAVIWFIKR